MMKANRRKSIAIAYMMTFFVVTACITIVEGILGVLFFPDWQFGFEVCLQPPIMAFVCTLSSVVTASAKELSNRQMLFRMILQLLLLEVMIFAVNYIFGEGRNFSVGFNIVLAVTIAVVFALVYLIMWLNDRRSAMLFNQKLKQFQKRYGEE